MIDIEKHVSGETDELELMTEEQRHNENKNNILIFLTLHLSSLIVFVLHMVHNNQFISSILIISSTVASFYFTKTIYGWSLVGIKWLFDKTKQPEFPFITFSVRQLPFVASALNSNTFWITLLPRLQIKVFKKEQRNR